jgi:hypothetical protein
MEVALFARPVDLMGTSPGVDRSAINPGLRLGTPLAFLGRGGALFRPRLSGDGGCAICSAEGGGGDCYPGYDAARRTLGCGVKRLWRSR